MYRFRLQFLLDFKIQKVKQVSYELSQTEKRLQNEITNFESLKSQADTYTKKLDDSTGATFLSTELAMMTRLYHRLTKHIKQQELMFQKMDEAIASQRRELIKIQQDVNVLEKLQAKQYQQYRLKRATYEQQLLDEITTMRFRGEHIV